jgi:hypothetical protein
VSSFAYRLKFTVVEIGSNPMLYRGFGWPILGQAMGKHEERQASLANAPDLASPQVLHHHPHHRTRGSPNLKARFLRYNYMGHLSLLQVYLLHTARLWETSGKNHLSSRGQLNPPRPPFARTMPAPEIYSSDADRSPVNKKVLINLPISSHHTHQTLIHIYYTDIYCASSSEP